MSKDRIIIAAEHSREVQRLTLKTEWKRLKFQVQNGKTDGYCVLSKEAKTTFGKKWLLIPLLQG